MLCMIEYKGKVGLGSLRKVLSLKSMYMYIVYFEKIDNFDFNNPKYGLILCFKKKEN